MSLGYDAHAPKRPVNLSLNEDLVRRARQFTGNLSEQVEKLLADYIAAEQKRHDERERRIDETIAALNEFDAKYGSFADEYNEF
ncbi:type II toxin-antitoxin system CcdA family antitoxin [Azospirillum sp.]|uniref:type II toxin-antitoxin system CcdA family antitoxin n=1 Tax=Azospirillum sp. TaxID=34012 RepID=UPI002D521065|nr:type II toxin-antitoxin system CcdA family antitoxin [Azospirillum sp.]HYD65907.1 type II toxin-antitoxin system CcdA family antitoxin [Azospirillum sp.]HYH22504.1 type II toxin-antitoxin system CcdA family antitoxin [Azospirillum sp.]